MLRRSSPSPHTEPDRKSSMSTPMTRVAILAAMAAFMAIAPASAEIVITQQKALAGNVTPGDAPDFPVTLSRSGAYSLGGNLSVPAGKDGIVIAAPDVTIDLNGFFMIGSGTAEHGITGAERGATILNGSLVGFGKNGIDGRGPFWIIRAMRVISTRGFAAVKCAESCHVEGSIVYANEFQAVDSQAGGGSVIGSVIANNAGQGVASGSAGIGNNALLLNLSGNRAGNTFAMHPNACRSQTSIGPC